MSKVKSKSSFNKSSIVVETQPPQVTEQTVDDVTVEPTLIQTTYPTESSKNEMLLEVQNHNKRKADSEENVSPVTVVQPPEETIEPPEPETEPEVKPKKRAKKSLEKISSTARQLRELFGPDNGYKFDVPLTHIKVAVSKPNPIKQAEFQAKTGKASTKDKFVNINITFRTIKETEGILSKFIPEVIKKSNVDLFPPAKLKFPSLKGRGTFDKAKHAPLTIQQSCHEFSLSNIAYSEDAVDENCCDPEVVKQFAKVNSINKYIGEKIAENELIAPNQHVLCKRLVELAPAETYQQRYKAKFIENYLKSLDGVSSLKFSTKMFRGLFGEEKAKFDAEGGYKMPTDDLQIAYEDAGRNDKFAYKEFPVIRPKTEQEANETFKEDPNPFKFIPFAERGCLVDGSLCSTLYQYDLTESYQDKSYLKLKPLLLIWFPDEAASKKEVVMEKPFVFGAAKVTDYGDNQEEDEHDDMPVE